MRLMQLDEAAVKSVPSLDTIFVVNAKHSKYPLLEISFIVMTAECASILHAMRHHCTTSVDLRERPSFVKDKTPMPATRYQ